MQSSGPQGQFLRFAHVWQVNEKGLRVFLRSPKRIGQVTRLRLDKATFVVSVPAENWIEITALLGAQYTFNRFENDERAIGKPLVPIARKTLLNLNFECLFHNVKCNILRYCFAIGCLPHFRRSDFRLVPVTIAQKISLGCAVLRADKLDRLRCQANHNSTHVPFDRSKVQLLQRQHRDETHCFSCGLSDAE